MRSAFLSFLAVLMTFGFSVQAKADYVVWSDIDTGLSLSWPDTWKMVSNADRDDVVTLMAPAGRGHAACRVRVRDDMRYSIYPARYSGEVQKIAYSSNFFDRYLAEYTDHKLYNVKDVSGLGRGFAGYAIVGYDGAVQGPYMKRKALIFASLYNNKAYIIECSSHEDAFDRWKILFLSIAGSIDFKKAHHDLKVGHYRDFMADPRIEFKGDQGENRIVY